LKFLNPGKNKRTITNFHLAIERSIWMSNRDEFGAFLVGFIVGGLTGAFVSLLMAPQSGEETRTVIKERAIELRDKASETAGDVYNKAEVSANEAVKKAEALLAEAKAKAIEAKEKGQAIYKEQKSKISKKITAETSSDVGPELEVG